MYLFSDYFYPMLLWLQLLLEITGAKSISEPMIVVVSATAKLFVGDIVETGTPTTQFFLIRIEVPFSHSSYHPKLLQSFTNC